MNEPDDLDVARRLKAHYRETATAGVPVTLVSEVRAMFSSVDGRRRLWTGRLAAVIAAVFVVLVGTAFALGRPGIGPPSSGSTAQSSTPVGSKGPGGSTSSSASASPIAPSPSAVERTDQVTVLRGATIQAAVAAATDDAPFLIGGRLSYAYADCAVPADFPETRLLRSCDDGLIILDDGFVAPLVTEAPGHTFANRGAVVVRVHTRDPRSADCRPAYRIRCERALVVEQFLWSSGTIPVTFSILPPQVEREQCAALAFEPVRCVAVVERARSIIGIGWPDIRSVELDEPSQMLLGGVEVAAVTFNLVDGTREDIGVTCSMTRRGSLVCGLSTVEAVQPSP